MEHQQDATLIWLAFNVITDGPCSHNLISSAVFWDKKEFDISWAKHDEKKNKTFLT